MRRKMKWEVAGYLTINRYRIWKKIVSILACITVFCTNCVLILPAIAMENNTDYCGHKLNCYSNSEADVESSKVWLSSLSDVELTGNFRSDLITVAESQLGYTESSQNYVVDENGVKKVYNRYNAWFSKETIYEDWNSLFVLFCLNYAKIPTEAMPRSADCQKWVELLNDGYHMANSKYEPLSGDLVFFDTNRDGLADRVGIITKVSKELFGLDSTEIETIQGNIENRVQSVKYKVNDDKTILGYGTLPDSFNTPPDKNSGTTEDDWSLQTYEGRNYTVTVTYSSETEIPENAKLKAEEYPKDSERYLERCAEAAELYGWAKNQNDNIRLFDIGFYVDNKEIEPTAEVEISITYTKQKETANYKIVHFGEETREVEAESTYEGGKQNVDFKLEHLSDVMVAAFDVSNLNGQTNDKTDIGTVQGITPNGTIINLFDYWLTDRVSKTAGGDHGEKVRRDSGINKDHVLKFTTGDSGQSSPIDEWTGSSTPRTGLVEKKLGDDGYPRLSEFALRNSATTGIGQESLAYLFDPEIPNNYKQTFRSVGGLLQIDNTGYYYYDCKQNFAELNEHTLQFTLYNRADIIKDHYGNKGQFFPFNNFNDSNGHISTTSEINHYFGMTMTSRFVQRYGGYTDSSKNNATVFEFSGDDDVWIFIDDVLVGDLGGIHDAASISIDFSNGNVQINGGTPTKLKQAFKNANVEIDDADWNGDTFADDTYHTLKFYYLERGNTDSDMFLKYNLSAIPATAIDKTDQYGNKLEGVDFSVYKANENWEYTEDKPAYTGTTNENGEMVFVNADGMPYTLNELQEILGEYCILKETSVPNGFRLVNDEVYLKITDKALVCENTYTSGVWARASLQVSAPTKLKLVNGDECDFYGNGVGHNGTLFAIVVKRVGNEDIKLQQSWAPVSGDSTNGYTVSKIEEQYDEFGNKFIEEAIRIAKEKNSVFEIQPSGAMELTMTDLPGKVIEYYYMLDEEHRDDAKFTIAYYWTSEDSLSNATVENTKRVNADAADPNSFYRTFGAIIEVPNLSNRLIVQKFDEDGKLINGVTFALFKADEDGSYIATNNEKVTLEDGNYTIGVNSENKKYVITTSDNKIIRPVEQLVTNNEVLKDSDGTCIFGLNNTLGKGCYYLREVDAPKGYKINSTPIMVHVTNQAVYVNAGTKNDGVKVARGPGYISSTLHKAASQGDIDNTLTWIYQKLHVSEESTSFSDAVPSEEEKWACAKNNNGKELVSYLKYIGTGAALGNNEGGMYLANYAVDNDSNRTVIEGTERTHTLQISTETGWSYNEIYQDYNYGESKAAEKSANYTDLRNEGDISQLFSRSVYVQVTDEKKGDLEISKTVKDAPEERSEDEFKFAVELKDENTSPLTGSYVYKVYTKENPQNAITGTIKSGDSITIKNGQIAVIKDLPIKTKYRITEEDTLPKNTNYSYSTEAKDKVLNADNSGYEMKLISGCVVEGSMYWYVDKENNVDNISQVEYTNTYIAQHNLFISKVDVENSNKKLPGAEFVFYKIESVEEGKNDGTEEKIYCCYGNNGTWTECNNNPEESYPNECKLTTNKNGEIKLQSIQDGTYYLKEIKAPAGYILMTDDIKVMVENGKFKPDGNSYKVSDDGTTVILNNKRAELPQVGGPGSILFVLIGIACCLTCGFIFRHLLHSES